jgi:hypothetical protein
MATPYNMAFACLSCCKSFKREFDPQEEYPTELACPDCSGPAHNFGLNFKAPKKKDAKQWQKMRYLFSHGFRFQKIRIGPGHHDVVPYPETLEAAREFVEKYKSYAVRSS